MVIVSGQIAVLVDDSVIIIYIYANILVCYKLIHWNEFFSFDFWFSILYADLTVNC